MGQVSALEVLVRQPLESTKICKKNI